MRDLERLAQLAPGATPRQPLVVDSAAVVDVRAEATPCPLCGGPLRLEEHAAVIVGDTRMRVARMSCTMCGTPREIFFRIRAPIIH